MRRAPLKHIIRLLPLCLLAFGTPIALAAAEATAAKDSAAAATAASMKIGVLDWQQLLTKAPQAEEAAKRLEKEFQGPKTTLMNKKKEFDAKQEKLQRDRDTMSAAELSKSEKDLTKLQQDLRHLDEELRSDYTARQREEMDEFIKIVREVVDKLAADEEINLVLPQEATLFINERIDVTEQVLKRLAKAKSEGKGSKSASTKDKK